MIFRRALVLGPAPHQAINSWFDLVKREPKAFPRLFHFVRNDSFVGLWCGVNLCENLLCSNLCIFMERKRCQGIFIDKI